MNPSDKDPRIVSLLPAATEYCFCLNAWDNVVGVSHECDFPPSARDRPALTRTKIDPRLPSAELNRAVQELARRNESLYALDEPLLRELAPDLILTQGACDVCAVTRKDLDRVLGHFSSQPQVHSFDARTFEGVLEEARKLGHLLNRREEARQFLFKTWSLAKEIRLRVRGLPRPRVAVLDWVEPLMFSGNWVPELVDMAGGEYSLVEAGKPSRWGSWEEMEEYEPDVIVAAPCGRTVRETGEELRAALRDHDETELAPVLHGRLFAADGTAYFNRPGPRLIYSAGLLARAFHWDEIPPLPPTIESGIHRVDSIRKS